MKSIRQATHFLLPNDTVSPGEKLLAAVGCFIAILAVSWVSRHFVDGHGLTLMVASMGASAILLFAVPHSPFSLPWSVVGGQTLSAVVGVAAVSSVQDPVLALALAVGGAAALMHFTRCLHPPGGATAAAAVLGGDAIRELGLQFAWTPVGLNAIVIVGIALALNNLLPHRDYPAGIKELLGSRSGAQPDGYQDPQSELSEDDLSAAIKQLNMFIDVDQHDLAQIYALATEHARAPALEPDHIQVGHCYSNGKYGSQWAVREILAVEPDHTGTDTQVHYRVVAGRGRRTRDRCSSSEFLAWARYEVFRNESCWHRVHQAHPLSRTTEA